MLAEYEYTHRGNPTAENAHAEARPSRLLTKRVFAPRQAVDQQQQHRQRDAGDEEKEVNPIGHGGTVAKAMA